MKLIEEKKTSVMDKLRGKLNIVESQAKADPKVIKPSEISR